MQIDLNLTQKQSKSKMKAQLKQHGYCYLCKSRLNVLKELAYKSNETLNNPNNCLITFKYYELNPY